MKPDKFLNDLRAKLQTEIRDIWEKEPDLLNDLLRRVGEIDTLEEGHEWLDRFGFDLEIVREKPEDFD